MSGPTPAHNAARQLDRFESSLLDAFFDKANSEIIRYMSYVKPGSAFMVPLDDAFEVENKQVKLTHVVADLAKVMLESAGWQVEHLIPDITGIGQVQLHLVRPERTEVFAPTAEPIEPFQDPTG